MKVKGKNIQILAPAGSFASLTAAINAGCDEVYFGIAEMNMRATAAKNFTKKDLTQIVEKCSEANVRTNITVNTLLYDNELSKMQAIVDAAVTAGVDAVIAADMATIQYCKDKNIEIHCSTQLSISNIETLKFYAQFADRVVLARELTLEQVANITAEIKKQKITGPKGNLVEIEVFAHGAICVAVSGRCSMSLYCNNTSANRGKCTQMCRREYKVTDIATGKELKVDNNYVMSAADLCTVGMLLDLINTGVKVLKFEGRGRPPEYVDEVISTYREALESIDDGSYSETKIKQWNQRLKTVFNRGQSPGFYMGRTTDEWAEGANSKATTKKRQLGVVEKYYPRINVAQVRIRHPKGIKSGDKFVISGPSTGVVKDKIQEMRLDDKKVTKAEKDDIITFPLEQRVREKDKMYVLTVDPTFTN